MKTTQNLDDHHKKLLENIAKWTQAKKFYLYGGCALDMLTGKTPHDYDIVIKPSLDITLDSVKKSLETHGFKILIERDYFIHINTKLKLLYAQKDEILLDIVFMDDSSKVGLFSIESIQWEYPEMGIIDKFDGLVHYHQKKIIPLYDINDENPYLMLSRAMRLAAKYDLKITHTELKQFINRLLSKLTSWTHENNFHTQEAVTSCYSSFFKSITCSADKYKFYLTLSKLDIVSTLFPELSSAAITSKINYCSNRDEVIAYIASSIKNKNDQQNFIEKIKVLSNRTWETKK